MAADVQVVSPRQAEASDGRIVVVAPAGTERIRLRVGGAPADARVIARRTDDGGVRFELQADTVAREGADLRVEALGSGGASLGQAQVTDVHLLGPGAFGSGMVPLRADARARSLASAARSSAGGLSGVSIACLGSGRLAEAEPHATTRAASTLKVAILATGFADTDEDPVRSSLYPTYRRAIVDSDNEAANQVLAAAGGGDTGAGTAAVNALFAELGMGDTHLDGPYVQVAGRSRKTTSAADLRVLGVALVRAARDGSGPLADRGVSRREARVLLGLMSSATYPGLVREHVPEPVAHKAGWLDDQQNDLAVVFGGEGGPCVVGIVTEGLSFGAADALGARLSQEVLPVAQRPVARQATTTPQTTTAPAEPSRTEAAPSGSTTTSDEAAASSGGDDGPPADAEEAGIAWGWIAVGALAALLSVAVVRRAVVVRRRQRRREENRRARGR